MIAIGIDIGATSMKAGLVSDSGTVTKEGSFPLGEGSSNETILSGLRELVQNLIPYKPVGIGIGSPGPLLADSGVLLSSANLPQVQNLPLKACLEEEFGLPVLYQNDANCAALAESLFGKSADWDSCLFLTLGTGIGGGYVEKGKLFGGFEGNGFELGHTTVVIDGALCGCGHKGCVEAYFSSRGFQNRYRERSGTDLPLAKDFFQRVRSGDKVAKEILDEGVLCLAEALRNAVHLVNPEGIVFVGGITEAWNLFGEDLEKRLRSSLFPILEKRLKIAIGLPQAGIVGAASLFFLPKV